MKVCIAMAIQFLESPADTKEWIGGYFDPNAVDPDELAGAVAKLAAARNSKPSTKRQPAA